ncbi:GAF domain-containing protein [Kribbella amoyensis]|uniref:GAF domain-containing protein n=1 Tax=Kribbella amoyensis TaxID=996641 RepID=A0A561BR70_9ACTN|nr:STAS domain-containing protein [Kribbella amoyensis]TWD81361.1 GAF domain-containing protein [Kribbella amoyensis]
MQSSDPVTGASAGIVRLPGPTGALWLVRAEGMIDQPDHPVMAVAGQPAEGCSQVVIDLSEVPVIAARGVRSLSACARRLRTAGQSLILVGANPVVARVLEVAGESLDVVSSIDELLDDRDRRADLPPTERWYPRPPRTPDRAARERREQQRVLDQLRAQAEIAVAEGILLGRYPQLVPQTAHQRLRRTAREHNVRLDDLAQALIVAPAPDDGTGDWFTGGDQPPAPDLPVLRAAGVDPQIRSEVLGAILDDALRITEATTGNVQLLEHDTGELRIAAHRNHPEAFLDFFGRVGVSGSACALALRQEVRVTVIDVATDPIFNAASRAVMLEANYRACHSVPLHGRDILHGIVSTHFPHPVRPLLNNQSRAFDDLADQAGDWLQWNYDKALVDALEDLHRQGTADRA